MKRIIWTLLLCCLLPLAVSAQNRAEDLLNSGAASLYITTQVDSKAAVNALGLEFSVDGYLFDERSNTYQVRLWLPDYEYAKFLAKELPFELILSEEERDNGMVASTMSDMLNWNKYPSYEIYLQLMHNFETNFPNLCKLDTILATTPHQTLPHSILAIHISNTLGQPTEKPAFLYSSTMHGDEVVGYYMMLRLIDYILNNATTDAKVQQILQSVDLYICPLENPDGTYYRSNTRIDNTPSYNPYSRRANYSNVDMNRNYPFAQGVSGSANVQSETQAIINWVADKHFVMSANFHGGAELTNYPWDSWTTSQKSHPDANWFQYVCQNYVDDCQALDAGYMVGETAYQPGCGAVTEGGDWYVITGSRQDYMNYYQHCREVTIEAHFDKVVTSTTELPTYWTNSKDALLDYILECTYGFYGIVSDAITGEPIEAKIFVQDHDVFNSEVYSHTPVGDYHRPIKAGTYTVEVTADCYQPQTFTITTTDGAGIRRDVQLQPLVTAPQVENQYINEGQTATLTASGSNVVKWYASETATTPLATGNSFTTPTLTQTTVYYVEEQAQSGSSLCVSDRTAATVFVSNAQHDTVYGSLAVVACDSYTINNQVLTVSGCYSIFFPYAGANGADSILNLQLTIHNSVEITVAESYMVNETYYIGTEAHSSATAGTFTYDRVYSTMHHCDSLVHYVITVNDYETSYSNLYVTECGSYAYEGETYTSSGDYVITYPHAAASGGDSVLTLHLTIHPTYSQNFSIYVSLGETYEIEGVTYQATGEGIFPYDFHYQTQYGCDSLVRFMVYVSSPTTVYEEISISGCPPFIYENEVLMADGDYTFIYPGAAADGADSILLLHLTLYPSYTQDVDVQLNIGETYWMDDEEFVAMMDGDYDFTHTYATEQGCDSIVNYHIHVGNVAVGEHQQLNCLIYPNPAHQMCWVVYEEGNDAQAFLYDLSGRQICSYVNDGGRIKIDLNGLADGIYFIKVVSGDFSVTKRIVKQ